MERGRPIFLWFSAILCDLCVALFGIYRREHGEMPQGALSPLNYKLSICFHGARKIDCGSDAL